MEKSRYREQALLNYRLRKSFENPISSPKISHSTSDTDFQDVFGGPPRCSINGTRHSLGEGSQSFRRVGGEDEILSSCNPWTGLSEKPVFGDDSPNRKRYLSSNFFDDIFRGDDSSSSTPGRPDRDPFSSTPASRMLSPTRPVPQKSNLFGEGPSLLSWLNISSLSSKLTKGIDSPTFSSCTCQSPNRTEDDASNEFGFPFSPSAGLSENATQTVHGQDNSRNDTWPSYRQSPLSHQSSLHDNGSSKATESAGQDTENQCKMDPLGSEMYNNSSHFHFSIYKWASKGVTLRMPAGCKNSTNIIERGKNESIVSGLPAPVLTTSGSFRSQFENQDNSSSRDLNTMGKDSRESSKNDEVVPAKCESKSIYSLSSDITVTDEPGLCKDAEKEGFISMQEVCKPELKPLHYLLNDKSDGSGKKKMVRKAGEKEGLSKSDNTSAGNIDDNLKVKKQIAIKSIFNHAETTSLHLQDALVDSEDKIPGNRVKGKVKEFVKIFNREASSKPISSVEILGQSSKQKDLKVCNVVEQLSVCGTKADAKEKLSNVNSSTVLADDTVVVDQILQQTEKPHSDINSSAEKSHNSSTERNDISISSSELTPEIFEVSLANIEESHCEDLQENCLVEQLFEDSEGMPQTDNHKEEIQVSDAKIRQWLNGKEGNIRSLLSTLQYVLWPDSGWKPVPLVDIIEGTNVKKAYQKALLCLHPDKLQQKGAAMHQKYIAEKVFDVLQEAWTHFNSTSLF
eukprot:TRINITY_DN15965_c0_g1_i1.p1 TRINITY_DN15965_c0_g1~~TRINITY_DN15965_c0_g1_i1.p1  ORF type:complete len:739 (+),score=126.66 TRINITY_DN15965_c0_g1_i1:95-2311(+)